MQVCFLLFLITQLNVFLAFTLFFSLHILLLHVSPQFTPVCPRSLKKKKTPTVTGDSRKELCRAGSAFLQYTSTRSLPGRVVLLHMSTHTNPTHTHMLTRVPQVQLLNYTITQSSNCPQQELFSCLYCRIMLPFVLQLCKWR